MDNVLARVHALAEAQHSMISLDQIKGCGGSGKWAERRALEGLIVRDGPAVFRMPGVPRSFLTDAMGAVLSCRGLAVVSHRSAAFLHGIEPVREPVRFAASPSRPGARIHRVT